jgi:hypothetical protein
MCNLETSTMGRPRLRWGLGSGGAAAPKKKYTEAEFPEILFYIPENGPLGPKIYKK